MILKNKFGFVLKLCTNKYLSLDRRAKKKEYFYEKYLAVGGGLERLEFVT